MAFVILCTRVLTMYVLNVTFSDVVACLLNFMKRSRVAVIFGYRRRMTFTLFVTSD